jgi:hypothetical protein
MQQSHIGERRIYDPTEKVRSIYIHGKAEAMMGYDVPVILEGDVVLEPGTTIPVKLMHPEDEHMADAVLWQKDETTWYITYEAEVETK